METEGLLDYQGWAGIISIVRWNLRPVIFGVDTTPKNPNLGVSDWGYFLASSGDTIGGLRVRHVRDREPKRTHKAKKNRMNSTKEFSERF